MARRVQVLSSGAKAVLSDPGVVAGLASMMRPVLAAAQSSAPVATGAHRASLRLESGVEGDRGYARVVATTDHSLGVESRTGHMARALGALRSS